MDHKRGKVVYTSGPQGSTSSRPDGPVRPEPAAGAAPDRQPVRVRRERAGRGGKTVTVAAPLVIARADASALLARLKRLCGSGGTLADATTGDGAPAFALELQGDHVDRVVAELVAAGFTRTRPGQ